LSGHEVESSYDSFLVEESLDCFGDYVKHKKDELKVIESIAVQ
jgi:hypothetical protein